MMDTLILNYFIDRISINSDMVKVCKEKDSIRLIFMNCFTLDGEKYEDGGDYVSIYLPLPLRFNEKWFEKYKEINLNEDTIANCISEEYLKSDLKE